MINNKGEDAVKLNIGSYNIRHGADVDFQIHKLGELISSKELDIVGIQEIDQFTSRSGNIDTIKLLSESSKLPYYCFFKALPYKGGEYGVGILSKYPIVETSEQKLPSGTSEPRVLGGAKLDVNGVMVNFFVTHLSLDVELRNQQFNIMASIAKKCDNVIFTGDFNTSDYEEYAPLDNCEMVLNSRFTMTTFPLTDSSIDNIIYTSKDWTFEKPEVVINNYSDHYMLYATGYLSKS